MGGSNKGTMTSGAVVSIIVALANFCFGGVSFVSTAWIQNLQKMAADIPYVGPYIQVLPAEILAVILSVVAIWATASFILSRLWSFKGLFLALVVGFLLFSFIMVTNV